LSVVVAKELHHALDFRRRLPTVRRRRPTVVFHSFIASISRSRAVTERLLKPLKDGGDGTGMLDFKRERRTTRHTGAARIGKPS
jgi:hypothetical protein